MPVPSAVDTVVVGAGQAGLTMSWFLSKAGRDHVVLERRPSLGGGWQDRWDEFCLVTPNWTTSLPGYHYDGPDPDGFMPRDALVARIAGYAAAIDAPVSLETAVESVRARPGGGFDVGTNQGPIRAERVVVAAGSFHAPRMPPIAAQLPRELAQLHAHEYRREAALPPGAVLVIGSGQSGMQIAEELAEAGRDVYLSVGSAGRVPRRYRGADIFHWLASLVSYGEPYGVGMPPVDRLPTPRAKFAGNPHLSGHGGGHDTNLREFASRGIALLGRIEAVEGRRLRLAGDLAVNLARADAFFGERFQPLIETYIERAGIAAPPDDAVPFPFDPPDRASLSLDEAGIGSVVWTTGYRLDYRWLDLPILDEDGYPRNRRGVTDVPGLFFLGLLWQHTQASATLFGVTADALHLAREMGLTLAEPPPPQVPAAQPVPRPPFIPTG